MFGLLRRLLSQILPKYPSRTCHQNGFMDHLRDAHRHFIDTVLIGSIYFKDQSKQQIYQNKETNS